MDGWLDDAESHLKRSAWFGSGPTSDVSTAFNPRQDDWDKHFMWSADGLFVIGLTPVGRATIEALALNRDRVINIRATDRMVGRHPPFGDPVQGAGGAGEKRV